MGGYFRVLSECRDLVKLLNQDYNLRSRTLENIYILEQREAEQVGGIGEFSLSQSQKEKRLKNSHNNSHNPNHSSFSSATISPKSKSLKSHINPNNPSSPSSPSSPPGKVPARMATPMTLNLSFDPNNPNNPSSPGSPSIREMRDRNLHSRALTTRGSIRTSPNNPNNSSNPSNPSTNSPNFMIIGDRVNNPNNPSSPQSIRESTLSPSPSSRHSGGPPKVSRVNGISGGGRVNHSGASKTGSLRIAGNSLNMSNNNNSSHNNKNYKNATNPRRVGSERDESGIGELAVQGKGVSYSLSNSPSNPNNPSNPTAQVSLSVNFTAMNGPNNPNNPNSLNNPNHPNHPAVSQRYSDHPRTSNNPSNPSNPNNPNHPSSIPEHTTSSNSPIPHSHSKDSSARDSPIPPSPALSRANSNPPALKSSPEPLLPPPIDNSMSNPNNPNSPNSPLPLHLFTSPLAVRDRNRSTHEEDSDRARENDILIFESVSPLAKHDSNNPNHPNHPNHRYSPNSPNSVESLRDRAEWRHKIAHLTSSSHLQPHPPVVTVPPSTHTSGDNTSDSLHPPRPLGNSPAWSSPRVLDKRPSTPPLLRVSDPVRTGEGSEKVTTEVWAMAPVFSVSVPPRVKTAGGDVGLTGPAPAPFPQRPEKAEIAMGIGVSQYSGKNSTPSGITPRQSLSLSLSGRHTHRSNGGTGGGGIGEYSRPPSIATALTTDEQPDTFAEVEGSESGNGGDYTQRSMLRSAGSDLSNLSSLVDKHSVAFLSASHTLKDLQLQLRQEERSHSLYSPIPHSICVI